jgi:hypothetical protein
MHDEAVLRSKQIPRSRTIAIPPPVVGYEQFRQVAWNASQDLARNASQSRGIVPIAGLRQALPNVPAATFNEHLLRLERNGLVYLIPPENPETMDDAARRESLSHPAGDLRAFVLWMSPKTHPAYFRD